MNKRTASRVVLSRYERAPDGAYFLDVAASTVTDLYNSYDKSAPFVRRDLDQHLVAYLISCFRELRSVPFRIRLSIAEPPDDAQVERVRKSIGAYFGYLLEKERHDMRLRYRRSLLLVLLGTIILFGSVFLRRALSSGATVFSSVLSEGLSILAWVSIWEASALFILQWFPYRRRMLTYGKLATAGVIMRNERQPDATARI